MKQPAGNHSRRAQVLGFSLLEVLVALLIVAIAVAALVRSANQAVNHQWRAEQRTLALWVADNRLAELRLLAAPALGRHQGISRLGNRDWYWDVLIQPAPGGRLARADVLVFADPARSEPILTHTGFLRP